MSQPGGGRRLRLLFLNHNVARSGGTFFRAFHFARALVERGHEVTVMAISPTHRVQMTETEASGVRMIETPDLFWGTARSGWDPWDTFRRTVRVRRSSWDVVHAFDSRPAVVLPALAAQRRGAALVMDWADWWGRGGTIEERHAGASLRSLVRPVETYFEEAFRTCAQATTVISRALESRAVSLGVAPQSILRLPGGSDTAKVQPLDRRECRRALGLDPYTPLVSYLGVLTKSDAGLLFDTFAAIERSRPDCRFAMIGHHKSRPPALAALTETGFVSFERMITWLGASDVLLLPLKATVASRGRWPSKINDYLAAGRPVVATTVGDVTDLFERHAIGRLTADTGEAMARGVTELLEDPAEIERLGVNARHVAESELAWPILAERLEAHYRNVRGLS